MVDGEERSFLLVVPASVSGPAALVIAFHGFTSTSERVEDRTGLSGLASEEGFVVAYPQGAGAVPAWRASSFQGPADVRFVDALIEEIDDLVALDPGRIFATGMSNGGGMAGRLACERAGVIAAIAPVAAAHPPTICVPSEPVAIVAFHALDDRVVRFDGFGPLIAPAEEWMADWAGRNGCAPGPDPRPFVDGVDALEWRGCDVPTVLYRAATGGHRWPGEDSSAGTAASGIDAGRVMWEFFASTSG
jgi:polyhydroxybutyrate depolymerase